LKQQIQNTLENKKSSNNNNSKKQLIKKINDTVNDQIFTMNLIGENTKLKLSMIQEILQNYLDLV